MQGIALSEWRRRARTFRWQGHDIAYWSEGTGPALVLIHGFPTASWDWHYLWGPLSRGRRVVACDMLGFGLSDKPSGLYSLHAQADLHAALLAHLGIKTCDVLAHDYGVSVAQELLARQIERGNDAEGSVRLNSIYFLNGGLIPGAHRPRPIQRFGAGPFGALLSYVLNRKRFGKSFSAVFGPDSQPTEAELDDVWSLIQEKDGHRRTHRLLGYMHDRTHHRERWVGALRGAGIPLGILNGALDPVSGAHLLEVALAEAPNLEATRLDDVGHYPQTEAPDRVLAALEGFLDRHGLPVKSHT